MIINQLFYLVFKTSWDFFLDLQPSLMSLLSYFHGAPRVCPILRDPYRRSYSLPPSQRPTLLWTVCSKLRPRKQRSERSIVPRIVRTVRDIRARAWRVHSRAPPTTSWWATRAVGEIKFGEIFVPIQSMSIERNFYPAKILCYTVYHNSYRGIPQNDWPINSLVHSMKCQLALR